MGSGTEESGRPDDRGRGGGRTDERIESCLYHHIPPLTLLIPLLIRRNKYNRRFVNKVDGFGKKGPNSNAGQAN